MRALLIAFLAVAAFAESPLERFTDSALNYTQRNTACLALRGDRSEAAVEAMRQALRNISLQACAAENLRLAGAESALVEALKSGDSSTRAVAARELGVLRRPEYRTPLLEVALSGDILAASNAIEGLVRYEDRSSAPELRRIAQAGGVMTALAMDALVDWNDRDALSIGRNLMAGTEPGDRLIGIRVVGLMGDASDLDSLRKLMQEDTQMGQTSRGFGLMPAVSIARAARTAVESIESRTN